MIGMCSRRATVFIRWLFPIFIAAILATSLGATAASAQLLPLASSGKQAGTGTSFDQFLDDARKAGQSR